MYLIQCIRFESLKVRRLSRALDVLEGILPVHVFKWKLCRLHFQSSGDLVGPERYVPERYPSNTTLFLTNMAAALGRHVNATSYKRVEIQAH